MQTKYFCQKYIKKVLIKPDIQLHYSEKIWNVVPLGEKYLLLELRDENTMTVYYDLYEFNTSTYQWQKLKIGEGWKTGICYGDEQTIILHEFKTGTIPAIANLTGIDCLTGKTIWRCNDFQPIAYGERLIKGSIGNKRMILSVQTGELTEDVDNFEVFDKINHVSRPLTYIEATGNFNTVKDFVKSYFNEVAEGSAEYLEYNNHLFIAYHTTANDISARYNVKLIGMTKNGEIWLKEELSNNNALMLDIFFIWNNYLIFFKSQHELQAINLNNK